MVTGRNVYGTLRNECGVHRVQRVPVTETKGRVHTSTAVVLVLAEPSKVFFVGSTIPIVIITSGFSILDGRASVA